MDCLEGLKQMEDNSIDLILTDPPYGIGNDKILGKNAKEDKRYGDFTWDNDRISKVVLKEIFRVSKNQIIFGFEHLSDILPQSRGVYVWDKRVKDNYKNNFADCELIWTSFDKPAKLIRHIWYGFIRDNKSVCEGYHHPTQKPLEVIRQLIIKHSKEGDLICDPFMGSGTTAVVCKQLKREFIGFELEQKYIDIANERLQQTNLLSLVS